MDTIKAANIDEYIAAFPKSTQVLLEELRTVIGNAVPEAEEKISYQIPTFALSGNLVHFAAYKNHIGFYPGSAGISNFKEELSAYEISKGTVRFPIDQPIPFETVTRIVQFRVKQNLDKANRKKTPSKSTKAKPKATKNEQTAGQGHFSILPAPARRALENKGISTLTQLTKFSEKEILQLHGMGPGSIPKLRNALENEGLSFSTNS